MHAYRLCLFFYEEIPKIELIISGTTMQLTNVHTDTYNYVPLKSWLRLCMMPAKIYPTHHKQKNLPLPICFKTKMSKYVAPMKNRHRPASIRGTDKRPFRNTSLPRYKRRESNRQPLQKEAIQIYSALSSL